MGTKYSSVSVSGYNATPPADDGTVSESNKVKWSTIKTKLADTIKTALESINSNLTTHFDIGPTALTANTTIGASHYNQIIQASGSSVTLTLSDAATLGAGWYCWIRNNDTSNNITLARATGADTINGTAANVTLYPGDNFLIAVNAAANGFITQGILGGFSLAGQISFTNTIPVAFTAGVGPHYIQNVGLTAAVATAALTIALKGKNGSDPSSTNKVEVSFRNATATTGDYSVVAATAATSIVVTSGATLGFTAAEDGLIYVYAINNAGTLELAVAKKAVFDEATTQDTTAIGAGSDSDNVLYSTSARTGVAVRLIGRIRITTGAVAGEWDNAPARLDVGSVDVLFDKYSHPALTSGTLVATTSGTAVDIHTAIPSWVKKITGGLSGVSTNGTAAFIIQLGDSGGYEATGYSGTGFNAANAGSVSASLMSTGFKLHDSSAAAATYHGVFTLVLMDAATNLWAFQATGGRADTAAMQGAGGTKALSGTLTSLRITTTNGTDTFDAGSISILYE